MMCPYCKSDVNGFGKHNNYSIINTALAKSLGEIADELENHKYRQDVRKAAIEIVSAIVEKHGRVIFDGDGYSEAWVLEAARRGLPNIHTFVEAVPYLTSKKAVDLFTQYGIFSSDELNAREEIKYEHYINVRAIEIRTMISMIYSEFIPALAKEIKEVTSLGEYMPKHFHQEPSVSFL